MLSLLMTGMLGSPSTPTDRQQPFTIDPGTSCGSRGGRQRGREEGRKLGRGGGRKGRRDGEERTKNNVTDGRVW